MIPIAVYLFRVVELRVDRVELALNLPGEGGRRGGARGGGHSVNSLATVNRTKLSSPSNTFIIISTLTFTADLKLTCVESSAKLHISVSSSSSGGSHIWHAAAVKPLTARPRKDGARGGGGAGGGEGAHLSPSRYRLNRAREHEANRLCVKYVQNNKNSSVTRLVRN